MATAVETSAGPTRTTLRLASLDGVVTRTILGTPLRDATASEIPCIDISPIFSASLSARKSVAQKIRDAAMNTGFFYITNHGVPSSVIDDIGRVALDFFHQDIDIKLIADSAKSPLRSGYKPPGIQRINQNESIDVRESFSWRYDPSYDPSVSNVESVPNEVLKYMEFEELPWNTTTQLRDFKPANITYFRAMLVLARALTRTFALSLNLSEDFFDTHVQYPQTAVSLSYYPPITKPEPSSDSEAQVSIGSHTDFTLFTVLWQDANGGLQVLNREGQWLNARPMDGTFVVNIADFMQRITNGRYVSTVHRVQNYSGHERLSIPFFWGFGPHVTCGVVDSCVEEGETAMYGEIRCHDYVKMRIATMLALKDEQDAEETMGNSAT